jgi:hypothetical protein
MKHQRPIIVRRELEKSPICHRIGIESRFCSTANFWETNLRGERLRREPDKAFHNLALCVAVIRGWPMNPGLCSNRAVEALRPKLPATSLFLCAVFLPARRSSSLERPSQPTTLMKSQRKFVFTLTQSSQRFHNFALVFEGVGCKKVAGMNRKANFIGRCSRMKIALPELPDTEQSKFLYQIPHICRQCFGNLNERIHRRRFFSAFDPTDKDCRKIGFFGQLFLGKTGLLATGANGFPQQTAMWLAGQHDRIGNGKRSKAAMSLTTNCACASPMAGSKCSNSNVNRQ